MNESTGFSDGTGVIIVDVQADFTELKSGSLAVPGTDARYIEVVENVTRKFNEQGLRLYFTQDWHPAGHSSFASAHPGKKPGDVIILNGLEQVLWPDHCVQGSKGAEFGPGLKISKIEKIGRKGTDPGIDSYSGFFDNGKKKDTGLHEYLQARGVKAVFIAGLATDYCVKFTALDAAALGYVTTVIADATRAVNLRPGDFDKALDEMRAVGVKIAPVADFLRR